MTISSMAHLIEYFGSQTALSKALGIRPQAVQRMVSTNHLPIRRAIQIERITGGTGWMKSPI